MADYFSPDSNPYPYGYQKQYPARVISGDRILELNGERQQTLIGHTLPYCNELESALNEAVSKAEKFYDRLVELGDIVPPKSAEELLQEQAAQQQEINATLLSTIQKLSDKIDRMEREDDNAKSNADSTNSGESVQSGTGRPGRKGNKEIPAD